MAVVRATYTVEVAWTPFASGTFKIGVSTLDGPDVLSGFFEASFGGAFDDVTAETKSFRITRGRDDYLDPMRAGECEIVLKDSTGKYNPKNASSPLAGNILPNRQVRIRAAYGGTTYGLFRGFARTIEHDPENRESTIHAVDLFLWLSRLKPELDPLAGETTGSAIGRILDDVGFSNEAYWDLDVGDTLPNPTATGPAFYTSGGTAALSLVEGLLETERGIFYMSGGGTATYRDRYARPLAVSAGTIVGDMSTINPQTDLDRIRNRWTVEPLGNTFYTATAEDTDSQFLFGIADETISSYYVDGDSDHPSSAQWLANYLLSVSKDPTSPAHGMVMWNQGSATFVQMLARELGDRVSVIETRSNISGDFHVEQITHEVSEGGTLHQTTWGLSERGAESNVFRIGISVLDGADVVSY